MLDFTILLAVLRIFLSAVFWLAAIGKLIDLEETRNALERYGVPQRFLSMVSVLLLGAEAFIGLGLIADPLLVKVSAIAAIGLLVAFSLILSWNLYQGKEFNCHCFGNLVPDKISWWKVIQNMILSIGALVVAGVPSEALGGSIIFLITRTDTNGLLVNILLTVLIGIIIVQSVLLYFIIQQQGRLLLRIETIERNLGLRPQSLQRENNLLEVVGSKATIPLHPIIELPQLGGGTFNIDNWSGKKVCFLFLSNDCKHCHDIIQYLEDSSRSYLPVAIIAVGNKLHPTFSHLPFAIGMDPSFSTLRTFHIKGTPASLCINEVGQVEGDYAFGSAAVLKVLKYLETKEQNHE